MSHVVAYRRHLAMLASTVAAVVLAVAASSPAATSNVTVTMTVASATSLDPALCLPSDPTRTSLGTVLPGTTGITSNDCTISFGSTNDTAMLLMSEHDGTGGSMARLPHAALDTNTGDGDAYDTDGRTLDDLGSNEIARAVEHQRVGANAGKIVVGGFTGPLGNADSYVTRKTTSGAPDATFNGGAFLQSFGVDDRVRDVVVMPDDSIIVVGEVDTFAYVFKLTPNGALDTTFSSGDGSNGWFTYDPAGSQVFEAAQVSADGRVIIAGQSNSDLLVAAIRADGSFDTSFGVGGVRTLDTGVGGDNAEGLDIDSQGRIVVAGRREWNVNAESVVARFTAAGAVDAFGTGGFRVVDVLPGDYDTFLDVAVLPNDRIVAVGNRGIGSATRATVAGLTTTGSLDTTGFAPPTGVVVENVGSERSDYERLVVHHDGRFVAVGEAYDATLDNDMAVVRYRSDGARDATFGTNGAFLVDVTGSSRVQDIDIGWDGKYVLAGAGSSDIATMRVEAVRLGDYASGSQDWATGTGSFFGVCLKGVGGSASAVWSTTGACTTADTTPWRAVPDQSAAATKVATTTATNSGTVNLRFGSRVALAQSPGTYEARITFDVLAPVA